MTGYDLYQSEKINTVATTQLQKIANAEYSGVEILQKIYDELKLVHDVISLNVKQIHVKVNKRKKLDDVYNNIVEKINSMVTDKKMRLFIIDVKKVNNGVVIRAKR